MSAFLSYEETCEVLGVSRRTLFNLFALCPRDPATKALVRGMSRLGQRKRFAREAVDAARASLTGRDFPVAAAKRRARGASFSAGAAEVAS